MKVIEYLTPEKGYTGYRMPAEWEPHECCWMGWPHDQTYWKSTLIETQKCYSAVANAIARFEEVRMLVHPEHVTDAKNILGDAITIIQMETDQPWLRDTGPNFLLNQTGLLAGSTWQFNGWGYEYRKFANDALIGDRILKMQGARNITSPIYAEGGSVTVDGEGTIITTEQCLLNKNRNSHFSRQEVEDELLRTLGCQKVIWLPGDSDDDETDGHIDGICAFVSPAHVVIVQATDPSDPRRKIHDANIVALEGQIDAKGRPIKITIIPEASDAELLSEAYCTAYVNSYIANGAIVMPKYNLSSDQVAADIYASLYPDRKIIQVNIDAIAIGGGGIHCITQQQPVSIKI
tara:strand:+ start:3767 stop:4810 length:1044 start_codon:yes stop_codon:yes gene_type:complete